MKELQSDEALGREKLLRLSIEAGGCSGFRYNFSLDEKTDSDDRIFEKDGVKLVVDKISLGFVKGATFDYVEELIRSAFQLIFGLGNQKKNRIVCQPSCCSTRIRTTHLLKLHKSQQLRRRSAVPLATSAERMQSKESSLNEEESFPVRKLEISDKRKGFIDLLQQLTVCDSVSDKEFEGRFQELSLYGDDHLVCVIEDNSSGKIVATGSVFIEKKFIRNCGKVGHIEDVVVDSNARGMQLGKKIIAFLSDHARSMGCYKVILDCSTDNKVFYEKCGFKQKEIQMVKYFT